MFKDIAILIADDHPLLLKGLEDFLSSSGFQQIFLANNGKEALTCIEQFKPHVAILDIDMPGLNGIEVAKQSQRFSADTRIILLSYLKDPEFILQAKKANISGYLIKEDAMQELTRCIRTVLRGEPYFSQQLQKIDISKVQSTIHCLDSLTPSEAKILKLISQGLSSTEIKELLQISKRTVDKHRSHIINKLDLKGEAYTLTQWARENRSLL